jgi:nucleoside-diphosphate-sugar epimerase
MPKDLPAIVVTGASGLIGRHFLEAAKDGYFIYALARRPQLKASVPPHPNLRWIQVDIADRESLRRIMDRIRLRGGADFLLHLAAFFDFSNREDPEYERTNVRGTRNVLEEARGLGLHRFVFASSLVVSEFPRPEGALTERSPADADFPYARSKRRGEEMVREFSSAFPCSVVRLAAVVSDWCEYPPLYVFLSTWLSDRWNSRILGGRGAASVGYIHVEDAVRLFRAVLGRSAELPPWDVYLAAGKGGTSQRELFEAATRLHFGRPRRPLGVSRPLALAGTWLRGLAGRVTGRMPFERPWMMKYIDRPMDVDPSGTWKALGWEPAPRLHVLRRLPFLIEKMKGQPEEWGRRNEAALRKGPPGPHLRIFEALQGNREAIVARALDGLASGGGDGAGLRRGADGLVPWLAAAARTGNRMLIVDYVRALASLSAPGDFDAAGGRRALEALRDAAVSVLRDVPPLRGLGPALQDLVALPLVLAMDEIEAIRERGPAGAAPAGEDPLALLERAAGAAEEFYRPPPGERPESP